MLTTIDTEKVMHQTIYTYLSENVWNTPLLECRRNIIPQYHNNGRAAINTVDLGCQSVDLPYSTNLETKKSFYVYSAAKCCMGGLVVDTEVPSIKQSLANYYNSGWLPLDVYLNHRPFDLRIHGIHGEWLYRNEIFIRNHPYQDMFLIAVEVKMARQILGPSYDFKKIFMSVYYDSDNDLNNLPVTSKTILCYHPEYGDTATLNAAYEEFASLSNNPYIDVKLVNGNRIRYEQTSENKWTKIHDENPAIAEHIFNKLPIQIGINMYLDDDSDVDQIVGKVVYKSLYASEKDQTMYFIDGRESQPASLMDVKFGQYVEVVKDPDIIYNVVMDLTKVGENNIYRSPIDDTYKYIIHIPKKVNPFNLIITHNTCDMFIRPINPKVSSDERLKGLFIHRFMTSSRMDNNQLIDHMITQITHNDFGISEKLLTARMETDIFDSSECVLRTVIRKHSKTKVLSEDANFIKLLYNFNDDEQILKILTGYEDASLSFWRAENLEQSNFAKMLVNFPVLTESTNTKYYMDALGYFNSLCILTPRVMRRKISDTNKRSFDVSIPTSMLSCDRIGLLVYLNGKKVNSNYVSYTRESGYQYLHTTIADDIEFNFGDEITFELFDDATFYGEFFTPEEGNNIFWLPDDIEYELYKVINEDPVGDYYFDHYPTDPGLRPSETYIRIDGTNAFNVIINGTSESKKVTIITGDKTETIKKSGLIFSSTQYGNRFFICSKIIFKRFTESSIEAAGGNALFGNVEYTDGTCTDLMHSGYLKIQAESFTPNIMNLTKDIVFSVNKVYYTKNENTYTSALIDSNMIGTAIPENTYYEKEVKISSIPIINKDWNGLAFMNDKELARDIDFTFHPVTSKNGVKGMVWFFNNISYLKSEGNTFELYLTSDKEFNSFSGFMHNRYAYIPADNTKVFKQGVVEEVIPYVYWFNRLCTAAIDGCARPDLNQKDGYLKIFKECRQGALYYTRGMVPVETQKFVDKHLSIDEDLTKLSAIAEYRKLHVPQLAPEIEVIPHSHHIASITMNAVVKDVLTGVKALAFESDPTMMLRQLTEYESLKKYDAAMSGVAKEITIRGSGIAKVNNHYKLVDTSMTGYRRRWKNEFTNVIIYCDYNSEDRTYTWKIALVHMLDTTMYFYATDPTGTNDPWELTWKSTDGQTQIPIIESGSIDLRYLDLFPSYSSDLHFVVKDVVLKQAMRALFPIDDVTDGDTIP